MTDNIVQGNFTKKKEDIVYSCINCGAQVFWLDAGGTVTCYACKARQCPPIGWAEDLIKNIKT